MKVRVIPSILTNGTLQVKGERFNNWRTVGSVMQAVRVHSSRDVDEILLLDVAATRETRLADLSMVSDVADFLRTPFTVGGGIRKPDHVRKLLAAGADKVCLGTASLEDESLVRRLADEFGSQAIVCALDIDSSGSGTVLSRCGSSDMGLWPEEAAEFLAESGAGEILLQDIARDGTLLGFNLDLIRKVACAVSIPVIASSGMSSPSNALEAVAAGAAAVAAGAILQFTEVTPSMIKEKIESGGHPVRK